MFKLGKHNRVSAFLPMEESVSDSNMRKNTRDSNTLEDKEAISKKRNNTGCSDQPEFGSVLRVKKGTVASLDSSLN